ncbi:hypothetical protein [Beijerinckia indica]|uniref:Uncharacterized protein n=1 Tax=Beijerinckia indica subsp. indica (strain ATCC 9039 / DSM 1715 / NCIMB 8712) TaxID=395963 RepID=B2IDB0_BEII9|nr:hypothetical protein [Beijerinckia indica]ACB93967.1 hypothetical protein Bind_0313 [Beijerinckia indica subsp. indica ATCC 9039]
MSLLRLLLLALVALSLVSAPGAQAMGWLEGPAMHHEHGIHAHDEKAQSETLPAEKSHVLMTAHDHAGAHQASKSCPNEAGKQGWLLCCATSLIMVLHVEEAGTNLPFAAPFAHAPHRNEWVEGSAPTPMRRPPRLA